jgi:radical SAM family uncharacterized protein/radical SAM-linked protein
MDPRSPNLLRRVSLPGRYLGGEVNRAPDKPADLTVALLFPEVYEVASSYLGFDVLYHLLNRMEGVRAERVYAPWPDYEAILRERGLPLVSLETGTPLSEFDVVGVTLQYELTATTMLSCFDLGGLPLTTAERDRAGNGPIVLAGGPGAANPEPLAPFLDAVLFGDAEEALAEIVAAVRRGRPGGRGGVLAALTGIEGIYIPSFYDVFSRSDGTITAVEPNCDGIPRRIRRRVVPRLTPDAIPTSPVVPSIQAVHDRLAVEVSRGCTRGCRFCQAGFLQRPVRERDAADVVAAVKGCLASTGQEEISFLSLSLGDYGPLPALLSSLEPLRTSGHVSVSFPSLRISTLTPEMVRQAGIGRKSGFTIAPEAGTERLRQVINKDFSDEEIVATARTAFDAGWERIKAYFMIGLPTETDDDLRAIATLAGRIAAGAPHKRSGASVTVSVSTFVPKPHTPFERAPQISIEEIRRRLGVIRDALPRRVELRTHEPAMSHLEGIFARGDRRLAKAVDLAFRRGARFDGWGERLDFPLWSQVFADLGIDPIWYANRERGRSEVLPWDHLDPLVSKEYLQREWQRALAGETTGDCRDGCLACGLRDAGIECPVIAAPDLPPVIPAPPAPPDIETRLRISFSKRRPSSLLGHLDTQEAVLRAFRRAGIPVARSKGFSPRPRIVFALPSSLGMETGLDYLEVIAAGDPDPEAVARGLSGSLPEGIVIAAVTKVPPGTPPLPTLVTEAIYRIELPADRPGEEPAAARVARLLAAESVIVSREVKGKHRQVDVRPLLLGLALEPGDEGQRLLLVLAVRDQATARPAEVLALLGFPLEEQADLPILRVALTLKTEA